MSPDVPSLPPRTYGCTFGCGNPYDFIIVSVSDSTTEFLCMPCYVRLATDMIAAVVDQSDPKVQDMMRAMSDVEMNVAPGPTAQPGRKNAPATATDQDLIDAYDDVITTEDLPEEFK